MNAPKQTDVTFEEINQRIWKHLVERDWQNNAARGTVISIVLEATELLEHYQWGDNPIGDKEDLAEELADIFIYAFEFAQTQDIDIATAIVAKLAKAAKKYPAEQFKGKAAADKRQAWLDAKIKHREQKKGL